MHRILARRFHLAHLLALIGLLALMPLVTFGAQPERTSPRLIVASHDPYSAGAILVHGETFTPDGKVYIALYDAWGAELYETRWTVAGSTTFGPDGSADPARGYSPGGFISETFGKLCNTTPMVRAYDLQQDSWSNWLDIDPGC